MEDEEGGWELEEDDLKAMGLLGGEQHQQGADEEVFPDIHGLFRHYNATYFQGKLEFCSVEWSTGRMTLCAGICMFSRDGGCRIKLSEPLLKYRPVKDLKETLLHEMIHAYQFLVDKAAAGGVRDDHGPRFKSLMRAINTSTVPDCHRPLGGYAIDTHHTMIDEVNLYRVHWWQCDKCSNIVRRAMNRRPQPADCRSRQGDACQDPNCLYHVHVRTCGGTYVKIKGPDLDAAAATGTEGQPTKPRKAAGKHASGGQAGAASNKANTGGAGSSRPGGKRPASDTADGRSDGAGKKAGGPAEGTPPITQWFKKAGGGSPMEKGQVRQGKQQDQQQVSEQRDQPPRSGLQSQQRQQQQSQQAQLQHQQPYQPHQPHQPQPPQRSLQSLPPQSQPQLSQLQEHPPQPQQSDAAQRRQRCLEAVLSRSGGAQGADRSPEAVDGDPSRAAGSAGTDVASTSAGHAPQHQHNQQQRGINPGIGDVVEVVELDDSDTDGDSPLQPCIAPDAMVSVAAAAGLAVEAKRGGAAIAPAAGGPASAGAGAGPMLSCPVCCQSWPVGSMTNQELNSHLDACLERL